jgi:hypothetical protein
LAEPCNKTALHCGQSGTFDLRPEVNSSCCDQDSAVKEQSDNCFTIFGKEAFANGYIGTGALIFFFRKTGANFKKFSFALGYNAAVYVLFNSRTQEYYNYIMKSERPSAGLKLSLYFGNLETAARSEILLAPGMHTVVSMVKEKHTARDQPWKAIKFYDPKKPCVDVFEYSRIDYGECAI